MNTFERAIAKHQKNAARNARYEPTEKKAEPVEVKVEKPVVIPQSPSVMKVTVDGPFNFEFEIHYGGTLMSSQMNEAYLRALFKKQLSAIGKVL